MNRWLRAILAARGHLGVGVLARRLPGCRGVAADYEFRHTPRGPVLRRGLRSLQQAARFAPSPLGLAGSAHLAVAWDCWHLPGPILGGPDPASGAWAGSLASWVVSDKCQSFSELPTGKARELEPPNRRVSRGPESESKPGIVHSQGTLGLLLHLWGHPSG